MMYRKRQKLYDVADIQKELEELSEDEDQIRGQDAYKKEIWDVKRRIKVSFKRDLKPPDTEPFFYKIGRVLGRGAYGKVNLAI